MPGPSPRVYGARLALEGDRYQLVVIGAFTGIWARFAEQQFHNGRLSKSLPQSPKSPHPRSRSDIRAQRGSQHGPVVFIASPQALARCVLQRTVNLRIHTLDDARQFIQNRQGDFWLDAPLQQDVGQMFPRLGKRWVVGLQCVSRIARTRCPRTAQIRIFASRTIISAVNADYAVLP